jgi:hypothetical protein
VHAARGTLYWTSLVGGACWIDLGKLAGQDQNCKNLQLPPRAPSGCRQARRAIGPFTPKVQTHGERINFGRFGEVFLGRDWLGSGHAFQYCSSVHGEGLKVITTPSREPVPRPRKGNPLGGPVRGIFISSPSHWPVSATVESRESGVVVVQGWWHWWTRWRSLGGPLVERIIVIRGPAAL